MSIPELIDYTLRLSEVKEGISQSTPKVSQSKKKLIDFKEDSSMKELSLVLSVVERLFIKGGEVMSENIKYLTPALTSKASASFKFEILKLLKVLLVDHKEDNMCPSPLTFAEHFIKNNGMHILLYLCINSPLDVISMCLKLIDVLSSLKKQKLSLEADIIPFLSNIILAKIKDKPSLFTPSGRYNKKFDLLPKIDEELEANMSSHKDRKASKRQSSDNIMNFAPNETEDSIESNFLLKSSTQKFDSMKFGLELDVDEANKHFNRAHVGKKKQEQNIDDMLDIPEDDPFTQQEEQKSFKESSAAKMRNQFMLDESVLKNTREVPTGPKSKSMPRNTDFFGSNSKNEEVKGTAATKGFNFALSDDKNQDDEEDKDSQNNLMIESGAPPSKSDIQKVIKKRFAFLDTGDKEKSKEVAKPEDSKKSKLVLNPAATGATELQSDSSSERSEVLNFKGKTQFKKPMINTEAINEMFSFGGEKGEVLIRLEDEKDLNDQMLREIDDIASICVAAMNRNSPDDEIIVEDTHEIEEPKNFMAPQTVKGYTKVNFSKHTDDDIQPLKQSYMPQENDIIREVASPLATSKSGSSKHDLNTPTSNLTLDTPKTLKEKAAVEEFNLGIEALYISILEWMLNRSPSNLNEPLMIDDSDEINNSNVLIICFNLIRHANDLLKQKALQDFQMLSKLNKSNCTHIIENKFFHPWILELLLPYQMSLSQEKLTGSSMAVYDIGTKLHTIVMVHSLTNEAKNRFILYLARWPLIMSYKDKTEFKITHKIECAYQLTKHLLSSIIKSVAVEAFK